jgi:hypothetical protein
MAQTIREGFGLGVGVSVARNVVDGAFGALGAAWKSVSTPAEAPTPQAGRPCPTQWDSYSSCTRQWGTINDEACADKRGAYDACMQRGGHAYDE